MTPIFVDTSALIALGNERDQFYQQAHHTRNILVQSHSTFLTTNFVIAELCNTFSRIQFRPTAINIVDDIFEINQWQYVHVDPPLMNQGIELFKQMNDKEWSLVDCVSMVLARELKVTQIFTNDHHFEQAGFQILMKP